MNIIKRDGKIEKFNIEKIINSISKANNTVDINKQLTIEQIIEIANNIEKQIIKSKNELSVEEIQDLIEKQLITKRTADIAKNYILYREKRNIAREAKSKLMKNITTKLKAIEVDNQNANVDEHSFGGRIGEAANCVMKHYALNYCMSKMSKNNHINNEIYIHDLDNYAAGSHNCLSIPFDKLLKDGFNTRQCNVRGAQSINTAFQLVAVIFQLQSLQQFGGVSATHIDWTMVPYVRKSFLKHYKTGLCYVDKKEILKEFVDTLPIDSEIYKTYSEKAYEYAIDMTTKETEQAIEALFHNLNTLQSRSGCQLPFTSINYGTCTSIEGRLIIRKLLEVAIKGIGKLHRTSIFPCCIFQCMSGVNRKPGDPNYDLFKLALECTSKRIYPNYANCEWSGNKGYDPENPQTYFSTMGCRTANGWDINCEDPKLGQLKDGRGNICPVTIILPTLAMEAKEQDGDVITNFFKILEKKIVEAKDMLIERFNWICSQSPDSAKFMYENGLFYGYKPEEGIYSALKHGTLALGQLGLSETLKLLIGKTHVSKEGMDLAIKIEKLFSDSCKKFKEEYKLNFGVYYTPAENLCHTALKAFKAKYGIIEGVSDKEFFTNSIHVDVKEKIDPFTKIDIESKLTGFSSAGCITYVEFENSIKNNLEALEEIVNYAMDKDIPYFACNLSLDECHECGWSGETNSDVCPDCGSNKVMKLRRVTGYLSTSYMHFNKGKQQEVEFRYKHYNKNVISDK